MLVPLWGMQELNAVWHLTHICMELPACCVWLPLEPQLEWKHQTSWWTFHTTTGCNPGVTSQLGAADCCLPPDLHDSLSCSGPLLRSAYQSSISAARIREGEPSCNFWIYDGLHVPSLRFWARVGWGRSQQVKRRSTHEWSEVNSPRSSAQHLFLCARHKNATRDLCICPTLSPRFRV